jgi:endonuclease YncB( thermonuclease family)
MKFILIFLLLISSAFGADFRGITIPPIESSLYFYKATPFYIIDGDTVDASCELGFETSIKTRFRLYGINAWEVTGKDKERGVAAKKWLDEQIKGKEVYLVSISDKREKYGRWLAIILLVENGVVRNINQELVERGHAIFQDY